MNLWNRICWSCGSLQRKEICLFHRTGWHQLPLIPLPPGQQLLYPNLGGIRSLPPAPPSLIVDIVLRGRAGHDDLAVSIHHIFTEVCRLYCYVTTSAFCNFPTFHMLVERQKTLADEQKQDLILLPDLFTNNILQIHYSVVNYSITTLFCFSPTSPGILWQVLEATI